MNDQQLKQLAQISIQNGIINEAVIDFVMHTLNRTQLKTFVRYLKNEREKNTITVKTAEPLNNTTTQQLENVFQNKEVTFKEDPRLGAGIYIHAGDNIIDLTLKTSINQTIKI